MMASQQTGRSESQQDGWCAGCNFSGWLASIFAGWIASRPARQPDSVLARNQPSKQAGRQYNMKSCWPVSSTAGNLEIPLV
jgi:hypothetical protein